MTLAWLLLLLLTACHPATVKVMHPTVGKDWQYVQVSETEYIIIAVSDEAAKQAQKAIGCGICSIQYNGRVWTVQRQPAK